jgi:hypothetical protein
MFYGWNRDNYCSNRKKPPLQKLLESSKAYGFLNLCVFMSMSSFTQLLLFRAQTWAKHLPGESSSLDVQEPWKNQILY